MKFLVIGLGSMGKRRVRCLQALNEKDVAGFDFKEERRKEAAEKHGITTYETIEKALDQWKPDAFIISVPPHRHMDYIKIAVEKNIHFFVEASVVDEGMKDIIETLKTKDIVAAPSSTLTFHPAMQMFDRIFHSRELGKISNIIYHVGQYLPDWHTYEPVSAYYVSNPLVGGGRELIPFELTWFLRVFGYPKRVCGNYRKTIDIKGAEYIDDTYNFLFDYGSFLSTVTIDVVSRYAVRRLLINGDKKQLVWSWDEKNIKIYDPEKDEWETREYEMKEAASGYNQNIGENMYIDEIRAYIDAIEGKAPFLNTMEDDYRVLQTLYAIESSDKLAQFREV